MQLNDKTIVLTGGTRGIGREILAALHPANTVAVVASNADRLAALRREFPNVATFCADLSDTNAVEAVATELRARYSRIDVLINNAAVQCDATLLEDDFSPASIATEVTVNLTAVCLLCAHLLPALNRGHDAAIVNVNSGLALAPKTRSAVYCATKSALDSFTRALRYQLGETRVAVMQAFLPLVETPMTAGRGAKKMTARNAAAAILRGVEAGTLDHDIGKVRILRALMRVAPGVARRIMKAA